eukprot:TRINITY_DN7952_c2_g1_i1.p1 TRINITY_DN7952_c2_g1~~TRINITY_DN7952_c2_g1_i1.p1  ORF type:complete len:298 (+),score=54.48 TRINITY_DN7952_c2_g1_i1:49-894(+)
MSNNNNNDNNENSNKDNKESCYLDELKINSFSFLDELTERFVCNKCKKSRKYFCYNCYVTPENIKDNIPQLELPIGLDIIQHKTELKSKSTAIHAKIIAPTSTTIYQYPDEVPEFENPDEILLLFPNETAIPVSDIDITTVKRLVVIDSQWSNTKAMLNHENLKNLKTVKIENYNTVFWRYQNKGDEYLATIEAIYFFYKEFAEKLNNGIYNGQVDNLLYFYNYYYNKIVQNYRSKNLSLESRKKELLFNNSKQKTQHYKNIQKKKKKSKNRNNTLDITDP